ncbi:hypothetical protein [Herbaspirillum sp. 1130]|uniref:hypothetical protein n=1 Tax=Herbaspirillum sp. 1130 TaxID=2806562 RepID=UPI001AE6E26E|nr:hypothetical protein [Herbaspirillum sp. 1130]MBP1314276.1 hypothetical protein [Herbaspirillum sp. 1130]
MKSIFAAEWAAIRTWWSVWIGAISAVIVTAVPIIADHWPDVAPGFVALFPKHGEQVAPVIGLLLTLAARLISQRAVIEQVRKIFKSDGGSNVQEK